MTSNDIPQDFTGLYNALMGKLKEERDKRRQLEADFTNYQREAKKLHEFLLSQMDEVMRTHAEIVDGRISYLVSIHSREIAMLQGELRSMDTDIALLKNPGKTNNNMKG